MNCDHRKQKENFPFGKKSQSFVYCKYCGKVITKHELSELKKGKKSYEVECECELKIKGFSENHANQNLKLHKHSKRHKERMELIRRKNERII